MKNDLITQSEAARVLGTSRQYVNKLVNNGKLKPVEIAGNKLVKRDDIKKMMQDAQTV